MSGRPARTERLSLRVHPETKQALGQLQAQLAERALHVSQRELVESFVARGLELSAAETDALIRSHRATSP